MKHLHGKRQFPKWYRHNTKTKIEGESVNYIGDFQARTDLVSRYGNNALMLYALQLRFDISDIISIASDALTDGGNDKKCDLIYVDQDAGVAVIAQGYMKQTPKDTDLAPGNKACDLNTAAAWAFAQNPDDVPEQIREQVRLLQSSIENNSIGTIYFWYVHNLNEQNNPQIAEELSAMQTSARILLKSLFSGSETEVFAFEVGNETIEKWYNASSKQINVTGTFEVETPKVGFEIIGTKWKAYITAVSARWLKEQYITYKNDLFSGNPRTYLGSGKKKNKINLGIMETIAQQPCNFWAYNNGVTALVNSYSVTEDEDGKEQHLSISGIFPENLTAKHIIFTYSLARAIDSYKLELQQKGENRTAIEEKQHKYLAKRGAKMLFLYTVSKCMEGVIGKKVRDNWAFAFRDNSDFDALVCNWKTVIKSILPMSCSPLEIALTDGLKSKELSENAADTVVGLFASVQDTIQSQLNVFTSAIEPQ